MMPSIGYDKDACLKEKIGTKKPVRPVSNFNSFLSLLWVRVMVGVIVRVRVVVRVWVSAQTLKNYQGKVKIPSIFCFVKLF